MKTYLCGGIHGSTDAQCRDWREIAKALLRTETLDPMRRDYRGKEDEHVTEIVEGDLKDIRASRYLLVNATRPSWGTAMEIVYAHQWGKTIVAFVGVSADRSASGVAWRPFPSHVSPWLKHHVNITNSLEEACERINADVATRVRVFKANA